MTDSSNTTNSLAHTKWNCKYHIVFAPKYRRKVFYEEHRLEVREILRKLCEWKGVEIIEGEVCPDHVHILVSIPPKTGISVFMGYLKKLPKNARPLFHSDQGWQYQHTEYQRLLKEHNITQSMSRKGNCMDNGAMENFFGRLKVEMFYGEKFESVNAFIEKLHEYIYYYNNERISRKLKGMSPVQYRTHSQAI